MTLWTDSTWQPLYDGSPYTGTDGTRYPPGFPKASIPGLTQVVETPAPANAMFYSWSIQPVEGVPSQVWAARPLAVAQANLIADLEEKRRQVETAGIVLDGLAVKTDPDTLNLLTRARAAMTAGVGSFPYQFATGWQTVDATAADAMLRAAGQHIQACAGNHQTLWTAITAATDLTELAAIDLNQGWPS